jgi:hypothetical protein
MTTRALAWVALSLRVTDAQLLGGLCYETGCGEAEGVRPCVEEGVASGARRGSSASALEHGHGP